MANLVVETSLDDVGLKKLLERARHVALGQRRGRLQRRRHVIKRLIRAAFGWKLIDNSVKGEREREQTALRRVAVVLL